MKATSARSSSGWRARWSARRSVIASRAGSAGRREHEELPGAGRVPGGDRRRLLQDHVGVGPAHAEGADPGAPGLRPGRPGERRGVDEERAVLQAQLRVRPLEVQRRRDHPALQRQRGLDQRRHPGRGVQVPDVALDRAQGAEAPARRSRPRRPARRAATSIGSPSGVAGAVPLDEADRLGMDPGHAPAPWPRTPAWPSTPGAVKPTRSSPSLLIAVPRITAWMVSPSARASARRLSTTIARAVAVHRPLRPRRRTGGSGRRGRGCRRSGRGSPPAGARRCGTPPARAMSHSPLSRLWTARCTATSEVEQAVCTVEARAPQPQLVGEPGGQEVAAVAQHGLELARPTPGPRGCAIRLNSR